MNVHDPAFLGGMRNVQHPGEWAQGQVETSTTALGEITINNIPEATHHMILMHLLAGTGTVGSRLEVNGRSGITDYSYVTSINGAADSSFTNSTFLCTNETTNGDIFQVGWYGDDLARQHLLYLLSIDSNGPLVNNAPRRVEQIGKSAIAARMFRMTAQNVNTVSQTYGINSNLSSCAAMTRPVGTPNFWQNLGTVQLEPPGDNVVISNIPNRRYLWLQAIVKSDSLVQPVMRLNNDVGISYATNSRLNFGANDLNPSDDRIEFFPNSSVFNSYHKVFIANRAASVKLILGNTVSFGDRLNMSDLPDFYEFGGKWVNATDAISEIDLDNEGSGDFDSGTTFTVWGSPT